MNFSISLYINIRRNIDMSITYMPKAKKGDKQDKPRAVAMPDGPSLRPREQRYKACCSHTRSKMRLADVRTS
jgi:hypothetical protein